MQVQKLSFSEQYIYKLKVLIMGDKNVGKSNMIYTYLNDHLPKSKLIKQQLSFHVKKLQYFKGQKTENQVKYQCRFHLWDVSGSVCNRQNVSKFLKQNLFDFTSAYILTYKDEKSFRYILNNVWPILPKSQITIQPIYLIQLESKHLKSEKQTVVSEQTMKQIQSFAKKQKIINKGKIDIDDPQMVYKFFEQIKNRLMFEISDGTFDINNVIIKDRNNKIILKDVNIKENQHFEKRYNRCC